MEPRPESGSGRQVPESAGVTCEDGSGPSNEPAGSDAPIDDSISEAIVPRYIQNLPVEILHRICKLLANAEIGEKDEEEEEDEEDEEDEEKPDAVPKGLLQLAHSAPDMFLTMTSDYFTNVWETAFRKRCRIWFHESQQRKEKKMVYALRHGAYEAVARSQLSVVCESCFDKIEHKPWRKQALAKMQRLVWYGSVEPVSWIKNFYEGEPADFRGFQATVPDIVLRCWSRTECFCCEWECEVMDCDDYDNYDCRACFTRYCDGCSSDYLFDSIIECYHEDCICESHGCRACAVGYSVRETKSGKFRCYGD